MNTFIVYMPRIANALSKAGFEIIEIIPNPKKPQYNAFVFEKTQEFLLAFTKMANHQHQEEYNEHSTQPLRMPKMHSCSKR